MSTHLESVDTQRMGNISMNEFAGGHFGLCVQLTACTPVLSGQKDMFQLMQLTKKDAVAVAAALMEWVAKETEGEL